MMLMTRKYLEEKYKNIVYNIDVEKSIARGRDHFRPNEIWGPVKLDEYFPKTILNNQDKYKDYIVQGGTKSVLDYWRGNILEERK